MLPGAAKWMYIPERLYLDNSALGKPIYKVFST